MVSQKNISIEELRSRLKGNGLVTEGEGVFRADHILVAPGADGRFVVRAVSEREEDGRAVAQRLRAQLADVANVEVLTGEALRTAS